MLEHLTESTSKKLEKFKRRVAALLNEREGKTAPWALVDSALDKIIAQRIKTLPLEEHPYGEAQARVNRIAVAVRLAHLDLETALSKATFGGMLPLTAGHDEIHELAKTLSERAAQTLIAENNLALDENRAMNAELKKELTQQANKRSWQIKIAREVRQGHLWLAGIGAAQDLIVTHQYLQNDRQEQKERSAKILEKRTIFTKSGEVKSLRKVAEETNACRQAETNKRIYAFMKLALKQGLWPHLVTITAPSRMHPNSPSYDLSYQGETAKYLLGQWGKWQKVQARETKKREKLKLFFIAGRDAHDDSTPHLHIIMFFRKADLKRVRESLERYFLYNDNPDEPGAREHRVQIDEIKPRPNENGEYKHTADSVEAAIYAAAKYAIKYVGGKFGNIDDSNEDDRAPDDDITELDTIRIQRKRLDAWASTLGIRRFSAGAIHMRIPGITVFRTLRKISKEQLLAAQPSSDLVRLWVAAQRGNHGAYIWTLIRRDEKGLEAPKLVRDTGCAEGQIIGIEIDGVTVTHRPIGELERRKQAKLAKFEKLCSDDDAEAALKNNQVSSKYDIDEIMEALNNEYTTLDKKATVKLNDKKPSIYITRPRADDTALTPPKWVGGRISDLTLALHGLQILTENDAEVLFISPKGEASRRIIEAHESRRVLIATSLNDPRVRAINKYETAQIKQKPTEKRHVFARRGTSHFVTRALMSHRQYYSGKAPGGGRFPAPDGAIDILNKRSDRTISRSDSCPTAGCLI
jgi:hypothetical protein